MPDPYRLVVFNSLLIRALAPGSAANPNGDIRAFRVAFQARRFRLLITSGIIAEYQSNAGESFAIQLQPTLDNHVRQGRAVFLDQPQIRLSQGELGEFPKEHRVFIQDAIRTDAEYLITNRRRWLLLAEHTTRDYGLHIVTPARFIELEA